MITGTKTEIKNQLRIKSFRGGTCKLGDRFSTSVDIDDQLDVILKTNKTGRVFFLEVTKYGKIDGVEDVTFTLKDQEVTVLSNDVEELVDKNFIDMIAEQNDQMEYTKFWLIECDKEVKRLFGNLLPTTYNIENIEVDLSYTPEEFAASYFAGYTIL
jgi:uncharacterized protein YlzI (FlbEa/FlbD family)